MTLELALRTMITTADALCIQACERDLDRAGRLTLRFDDAYSAFLAAGGDPDGAFIRILVSMVEQGCEWRGKSERAGERRLAA